MGVLKGLIISIFVFSIIIFGGLFFVGEITSNYGVDTNTTPFENTFDRIEETHQTTEDMEEAISEEGGFLLSGYNIIVKGSWYVLKMILNAVNTVRTMIYEAFAAFGIPIWFALGLIGIITVVIVTAIISLVFKRDV